MKILEKTKKWIYVSITGLLFSVPLLANAISHGIIGPKQYSESGITGNQLIDGIGRIVGYLIGLGLIIAVLYIVFAGFKYIFAGGDPEAATKARTMLYNGVIGVIIIIAAYAIIYTARNLLAQFFGV